jgi:threonine/homoserine/homoserine lactone efflux protein
MEPHRLAALLLASAVNAVIPGPGMVLAIARAASDGLGAGIKVSLGMILETLLIRCAVCAVLVGLFHLSELCGPAASRSGAWSWRSSRSRSSPQCRTTAASTSRPGPEICGRPGGIAACGSPGWAMSPAACLTGLTSPVHLLFMLALVPQFVDMIRATPRSWPDHRGHLGQDAQTE